MVRKNPEDLDDFSKGNIFLFKRPPRRKEKDIVPDKEYFEKHADLFDKLMGAGSGSPSADAPAGSPDGSVGGLTIITPRMRGRFVEQKEHALDYLSDNVVAKQIHREHDMLLVSTGKDVDYALIPFVHQSELDIMVPKDATLFDARGRHIKALGSALEERMADYNSRGLSPVFLFRRAKLVSGRYDGPFGRKKRASVLDPEPSNNKIILTDLELAVEELIRRASHNAGRNVLRNFQEYRPSLTYLIDDKRGKLQVFYTRSALSGRDYAFDDCPVCARPEGMDHGVCKKEKPYQEMAWKRDEVRASRLFTIVKERKQRREGHASGTYGGIRLVRSVLQDKQESGRTGDITYTLGLVR
ncbi:MAG: hypothetical protein GXP63_04655 [DPANN group archaeon]|nr:hypothetical protein [DPANN group archaeon]